MTLRFDVEGYVSDRVGIRARSEGKHGYELICDCPFCDGKSKLYVNVGSGRWICFRCRDEDRGLGSGAVVQLVELLDGLSRLEAMRFVRRESWPRVARSIGELKEHLAAPDAPPGELFLPDDFVPVWDAVERSWHYPRYLRDRGVRARTAASYGLGHCKEGRYAGRVICPARVWGRLVTFQGRAMGPWEPKYLGPPLERGSTLYGLDEVTGTDEVAVVEGPFDVLGMAQAHRPAVALMGKIATGAQASLLADAGVERVVVLLDPEAYREAHVVAAVLGELLDVRVARLPDGVDPGAADLETIAAALVLATRPTMRGRWA